MMVDKKLLLSEVAERHQLRVTGTELHCLFNDADRLILRIRVMADRGRGQGRRRRGRGRRRDSLKKVETSMLDQVRLQGVEGIRKVFLRGEAHAAGRGGGRGFVQDTEWVLDTEGGCLSLLLLFWGEGLGDTKRQVGWPAVS